MKYILPTLLLVSLLFNGCKKKTTETVCYISKIYTAPSDSVNITYDTQHRITDYNDLENYLVQVNYAGLSGTSTSFYADSLHPFYTLYFNGSGNILSMHRLYTFGGTAYDINDNLKYDSDNHLVWQESVINNYTAHTTTFILDSVIFENGNMTHRYSFRKTSAGASYVLSSHSDYTYTNYTNKIGLFPYFSQDLVLTDLAYFYPVGGKASANLPATGSYIGAGGGTDNFDEQFSYTLNADGYPTEENIALTGMYGYTLNRKFNFTCE